MRKLHLKCGLFTLWGWCNGDQGSAATRCAVLEFELKVLCRGRCLEGVFLPKPCGSCLECPGALTPVLSGLISTSVKTKKEMEK